MNTSPIQLLKTKYQLPIDVPTERGHETSLNLVVQRMCEQDMTEEQYREGIALLLGTPSIPPFVYEDKHKKQFMSKYVFRYLVQNIVGCYVKSEICDLDATYLKSIKQAETWIEKNPFVFATGEDENVPVKLDSNGNIQPKKGDKKSMAIKWWNENKDRITALPKDQQRKTAIAELKLAVGLTDGGASTYYQNLKTGVY